MSFDVSVFLGDTKLTPSDLQKLTISSSTVNQEINQILDSKVRKEDGIEAA